MKKLISIVISASLLLASLSVPVLADGINFCDFDASHWAYSSVMTLVNEGTVKGYEDGGFHPSGTVTRAEFVKMIGKGATVRTEPYADVPNDHWGYDYIMASGLKTEGNNFEPSAPIKRGEVLELIWSRNGSVKGVTASGAVKNQWNVPDAAAWGYTYGIMIGNDGVNMRLEDSLTRAEAAALIIRGRNYASATPINFENTVSEDVLKLVLLMTGAFDGDISDLNRKVTNGEVAVAALRVMNGEQETFVDSYPTASPDTEQGRAWGHNAIYFLKETDFSEQMVNTPAKLKNSVAMLTMGAFGGSTSSKKPFNASGYAGILAEGNLKFSLSVAKGAGVEFRADGTFDGDKETTLKDAALILLQLDYTYGLKDGFAKSVQRDEHLQTDMTKLPWNMANYPAVLKSVPAYVYEAPDYKQGFLPCYEYAKTFALFQINPLTALAEACSKSNFEMTFVYYPSLVKSDKDNSLLMRVKLEIKGDANGKTFKEVFGEQFVGEDAPIEECFVEVATATPMLSAAYPYQNLIITKVIK